VQKYYITLLALWLALALVGGIAEGVNIISTDDQEIAGNLEQSEQITSPTGITGWGPFKWISATFGWIAMFFQAGLLMSSIWDGAYGNLIRVCLVLLFFGPILFDAIKQRVGG